MDKISIPAGLIDGDMEFFIDPRDQEICYCLTGGRVRRINELSESIKNLIDNDIQAHPNKVEALVSLGYETQEQLREKYCSCCFGAFDGTADFKDGQFIHNEYWRCPKRGQCPVEGILCDALKVGPDDKFLSKREIAVLIEAGKCQLNKEIADRLNISEETVKVHLKHIYEKSGLMNKMDLVLLAHQKNLL